MRYDFHHVVLRASEWFMMIGLGAFVALANPGASDRVIMLALMVVIARQLLGHPAPDPEHDPY